MAKGWYLTVEEVRAGTGMSAAMVYWYAHRDGWRRFGRRPVRYLAVDVLETIGATRRRGQDPTG